MSEDQVISGPAPARDAAGGAATLAAKKSEVAAPRVLTVRELADYLRVHPTTVYRLLRSSQLPAFRVGSDLAFQHRVHRTMMQERGLQHFERGEG